MSIAKAPARSRMVKASILISTCVVLGLLVCFGLLRKFSELKTTKPEAANRSFGSGQTTETSDPTHIGNEPRLGGDAPSAHGPRSQASLTTHSAQERALDYWRYAVSEFRPSGHGRDAIPSIEAAVLNPSVSAAHWLVRFSDGTRVTIRDQDSILITLLLGCREERRCRYSHNCDGAGSECTATQLKTDWIRDRSWSFLVYSNPFAAGAKLESPPSLSSGHHSTHTFHWKLSDSTRVRISIDPCVGDVISYSTDPPPPEPRTSITGEVAGNVAMQHARSQHPEYFRSKDSVLDVQPVKRLLITDENPAGVPLWVVAIKVRCECSQPPHEKFLEYFVNASTGELDKSTGGMLK